MADPQAREQHTNVRVPLYNTERNPNRNSGIDPLQEQQFLNCYPEIIKNYATDEREIVIRKRPPLVKNISLASHITGTVTDYTAVKPMDNMVMGQLSDVNVCAVFDNAGGSADCIRIIQYRPVAGTTVLIGTISSSNTTGSITPTWEDQIFITEIEQSSGGSLYPSIAVSWKSANSTGSDIYYAISASGVFTATSLTQVTAASCPTILGKQITGPIQQLNGVCYIMGVDGYIYGSGGTLGTQNDINEWNSLNNIKANQSPDAGIGVFRYKHHLLAISRYSIEFYNDVANEVPASALGLTDQAFIKMGCQTAKQITIIDDTIYYIGSSKSGVIGVYRLQGYTETKISSSSINNSLASFGNAVSELRACRINGAPHLILIGIDNSNYTYPGSYTNNKDNITTVDTYNPVGTYKLKSNIAAYNVNDDLWWTINFDVPDSVTYVNFWPVSTYHSTTAYSYICALIWDNSTYFNKAMIYKFDGTNLSTSRFLDSNGSVASEVTRPYSCFIKTNTMSFGNPDRKRISKARLGFLQAPITGTWGWPQSTQSIYLGVKRTSQPGHGNLTYDEFTTTGGVWRRKLVDTAGHWDNIYWNNLGQGRTWQFGIYYYGDSFFSPSYLDITLINGTK